MYTTLSNLRFGRSRNPLKDFWALDFESPSPPQVWQPACDVIEDATHFLLSLDVPGIPKDQIKVETLDNQLVISGERRFEEQKSEGGMMVSERRYGKFERRFELPTGLKTEGIEATYADGILKVRVPKFDPVKPRQIKIESDQNRQSAEKAS